ncbi:F0F1 ATP synthase subunit alpha [Candidatus Dependentiae bacterium]
MKVWSKFMTKQESADLISILERSLKGGAETEFEEIGTVVRAGDGVALVYGLDSAMYYEVVEFEGGNVGVILGLDEHFASVVFFDQKIPVVEQEIVRRTGEIFKVPVGEALLGRVVSATGKPVDGIGDIVTTDFMPVERSAPTILERSPIDESLETGIMAIDSLIPIGKGQRELLIGNRTTGKTTILVDAILHQKGRDVICIFVSIGHKQSTTAKVIEAIWKRGGGDYTIVVAADAHESALSQFFAPYVGCSIGEYFAQKGRDVFIVYDDLSAHAVAYRELSLLLRRPPGREAFPGDIFYIHSRLLERASRFSDDMGGGSLTAVPVIQTQEGDFSAYIPTNLVSITDGQIYLDAELFNEGIRPAVNIGLSVSRVGGKAQTKAIKKVAGRLKLDLAQYDELVSFSKFGSELDQASLNILEKGKIAKELLKQKAHEMHDITDQVIFAFLLKESVLDGMNHSDVKQFAVRCASFVRISHPLIYNEIRDTGDLTDTIAEELKKLVFEFRTAFEKDKASETEESD